MSIRTSFIKVASLCIVLVAICCAATQEQRWEVTRSTDTIQAYEEFLRKYSDGEYVYRARTRLKKLYAQRDWTKARSTDTIAAYEEFLQKHSDGQFTDEARTRLKKLYAQRDWTKARSTDTIRACESFLRQYLDGELADQARTRLGELYKQLKHTKVLKLVVTSSTWRKGRKPYKIEYAVREKLKDVGFIVVSEQASNCDATVTVMFREKKGTTYSYLDYPRKYIDTNAICDISVTHKALGIEIYEQHYRETSPPLSHWVFIDQLSEGPQPHYFDINDQRLRLHLEHLGHYLLMHLGVVDELAILEKDLAVPKNPRIPLQAVYALRAKGRLGVKLLIIALKAKDWLVRYEAARALGEIGDWRAIAPLGNLWSDPDKNVRKAGEQALQMTLRQNPQANCQARFTFSSDQKRSITQAQLALAILGYDPGPSDGIMGRRTCNAIKKFQRGNNLQEDGILTRSLLLKLQEQVEEEQVEEEQVEEEQVEEIMDPQKACEEDCKRMFEKRELKPGITVEECIKALCK